MKAERRHELKSNSLSHGIENLPEFWRTHGNKLLLVLIAILLAIIVVRYRNAESEHRARIAKESLTAAELEISQLRNTAFWNYSPDSIAGIKSQHAGDAEDDITRTLENADDSNVRARAYVDRGDLNFLLANFATLPPTTRPTTATPRTPDEYLSAAESAYNEVLKEPLSQVTSRSGARSSAWRQWQRTGPPGTRPGRITKRCPTMLRRRRRLRITRSCGKTSSPI